MKHLTWLAVLAATPLACRGPAAVPTGDPVDPERALEWTVGTWQGVRRDGEDGSEGAMVMRVAPILGGAGQTREMEIAHAGGLYRGFCVQVFDPASGRWSRMYANDVRRSFSPLEGVVEGDRSVWRGVSPARTRETELVSERPSPDVWVRTMNVSEDGGATWRVLWVDELRRR